MRFGAWSRAALISFALAFGLGLNAQQAPAIPGLNPALPLIHVENGPNSPAAQKAHYVVLVSLDGFRWDYANRDNATNLLALGNHGVWAPEGMLPSFPSLTFPNHFTIVTGLYPEHHGLVANSFYDESRQARYAIGDPKAVADGSWYAGVPLWSLAESQGMRTACLFWPGSEAKIAGYQPTYYARFDSKTEATDAVQQARIDNAVALLKLPSAERPHFITIYYSEPDHEGHSFGPDAPETRAAELKMDAMVGKLKAALDSTGLPIDLVVLSDHGMVKIEGRLGHAGPVCQPRELRNRRDLCSMARPKKTASASTTSSRKPPRSSSFTAARMCQPGSTSTRIRARATQWSSPPALMPFAPTRPRTASPIRRPSPACMASILARCRR